MSIINLVSVSFPEGHLILLKDGVPVLSFENMYSPPSITNDTKEIMDLLESCGLGQRELEDAERFLDYGCDGWTYVFFEA